MTRSALPSLFGRDGDIGSLFRDVERVFDDFSRRAPFSGLATLGTTLSPRIDVAESEDAFEVTAEIPGCTEKDIEVVFADGVLTIRGEKRDTRDEQSKSWHRVERSYGAFSRSIELPFEPHPDAIEARFENGILNIRVPKPPEAERKPHRIEVRGGRAAGQPSGGAQSTVRPPEGREGESQKGGGPRAA